jgi:hypothetical protein
MKVQNSVSKLSYLPDQKSICEKYGLYITDPIRKKRKKKREVREEKGRRPKYRYRPRTHYYEPDRYGFLILYPQAHNNGF